VAITATGGCWKKPIVPDWCEFPDLLRTPTDPGAIAMAPQ
jgi:hypothetical protein